MQVKFIKVGNKLETSGNFSVKPLRDTIRDTRLPSLVNDCGSAPERALRLKSKDSMEDISEIEFGIGPEKLFPANDRFCKLSNLPIPSDKDEEKRLLEISRNSGARVTCTRTG